MSGSATSRIRCAWCGHTAVVTHDRCRPRLTCSDHCRRRYQAATLARVHAARRAHADSEATIEARYRAALLEVRRARYSLTEVDIYRRR